MVFVLSVLGCAVFTTYAAGLFFRQKSRETGVFLALGASRKQLQRELGKELALISLCSCAAGAILGGPLAWGVWQLFRLFWWTPRRWSSTFDPQAYLLSLAFAAYVVVMLFLMGGRSVRKHQHYRHRPGVPHLRAHPGSQAVVWPRGHRSGGCWRSGGVFDARLLHQGAPAGIPRRD